MTISVSTPGGATIQFPDGTDAETISRVMAQATGSAPKEPETGALKAAALGASQGLTFGFGDELYGAGKGAISAVTGGGFSDAYAKGRDEARAAQKKAAADQPLAYYGGEIAGGVALPFGAARAAGTAARAAPAVMEPVAGAARTLGFGQLAANSGANLGARTIAGVREGAAYGAAYGLGQGEGGASERAASSASGAALGGAFGAAAPALVDGVSAVARGLATPVRAAMNPQAVGREKLAEALMRDVSGEGAGQPGYREAFQRLTNRMDTANDAGKNMMLADFGGENTRNLLRSAANQQSSGAERMRKTLDTRQGNQWARIERDLADTLADPREFATSVGDIVARRTAASGVNFPQALAIETPMTPQLSSVLQRPTMRQVVALAERRLADEGQPIGLETRTAALHRAKVEIDNQLRASRRAEQMGNNPGAGMDTRTLTILKRDLLNAMDNPTYRRALNAHAGESALVNAAEDGFERALTMHTEEIPQVLRGLTTDAEREMWRLGAARALAGKIRQGNVTRDRTENVFSSPDIQMRLRAIMPDQAALRRFQRSLVLEAKMADTRKAVQGGPTTAKQLAQGEEAAQPARMVGAVAQAASGRFEPVFNWMGRQSQRFTGITPASANAIIAAAMERDPQNVNRALQRAIQQAGNVPAARARLAQELIGGATSAATGSQ